LIQAGPPGSMAGRARGKMVVLRAPARLLPATPGGWEGFARSTTLWTTTMLMDKEKEVWLQLKLLLDF